MGGADEHLQSPGRGDPDGGAYQQLTLNLFLSEAEQIQSIDEAENVAHTSSAFSFAQNDIDHVLRLGGNTDRQRERVVAAFEKQKTTAEITEILKTLYHGGNGLGSVSAWYAEDGIHLSHGKSVRYDRSAQVISWESAAERIGELLESGQFASNVELAEATGYERSLLSEKLWHLYHDLSEDARKAGYLSCLSEIKGNGFPEETRRLTEQLSEPAFRQTLKEEYAAFLTAYQQDRDLLRFHYHRPREIWENLKDLDLPRRTFSSDLSQVPTVQHFITEDEIDAAMTGGSSFAGGKGRIYAFFMENHTDKEKVRFLKDEYGIGGRSHALSGATHSGEDHDGKGLHYKKQDCPDVHLNWEKVAKRITSLVQKGRYLTEQEQAQYDKIQAEKELAEEDAIQAQQPEVEEETPKPTLREQFEQYKTVVTAAISEDAAYRNACGHSDRENAVIEGNAAVRRAVLGSKDMELIRLYSDVPEFRQRLHREVIDETYPKLHELLRPLSQEDIDTAICAWNGNIESKHAVVRYMKDHAREKDTAAWLAQEYGGSNSNSLFVVRAGSPEETQLPWPKVQRRLAQLIQEDRFYTEEEQNRFDDIDPIAIREALEERGIVNGQVTDPEKLDNDPFIQQVMSDAEQIADAETEQTSKVSISDEEYDAVRRPIPQRTSYDPAAPVYAVGDTVYIEDDAYQITELREDTVQLLPTGMVYPIYRAERKEQFEQLLRADRRNAYYTEFLPIAPDKADQDLRDVLAHGLMDEADKKQIFTLLQSGRSNSEIAYWLSRAYSGEIETLNLETGDIADYRTTAQGIELEVMDAEEKRLAMLYFRWDEVAPLLRGMYARQQDGFGQEQPQPTTESPTFHSETMAVYPGDKNHLPYDVVVEQLHIEEPEPPAPVTEPEKTFEEVLDEHPVSIQVNGQWQTFPNAKAAEEASYEEYKANLRRNAKNFRITDEHLGEGGPKAKFQANVNAIRLLKELEAAGQQASPEQQEVLSRYVGWGGLSDAFDPEKPAWALEYAQLKELLTPEEYAAARGSTLNAHYTSPTVIRAIYETMGRMGFETGNILEPSCGVGNFFGMLPEEMRNSRLYGVELDSISGRIAKQLYPKADITVAGFETTDRRDFYDLAIGNVPFGQYQVNDKAYNKLNFSIHNYFFAKALDQVRPGGVVAFVTSRYTMDAKDSTVRRYLAQRAELLGVIRLPNDAFKKNAGAEVVSDIIFLQKRDRPLDIVPEWTQTGQTEDGFAINRYFIDHPEMVLGRQEPVSTAHGMDYTVNPIEGLELADQLHDAVKYIRGTYQEAELPELGEGEAIDTSIPADPNVKNYSYAIVDGQVYYRENSRMVRPDLNATAEARVKGLVGLRDCVQELIDLQMDAAVPDSTIREKQAELNSLYDSFSAKYGLINDRANRLAYADDSSYYLLCALEVIDEDGKLERKADMFTKRTIKPHQAVAVVDTASEALAVSISEKACVDMDYMSQLTGKTKEELAGELQGVIFRVPGQLEQDRTPHYVTADEYLSGNVRRKLRQAQRAAQQDPVYAVNVEALTAAQPKDLDASEIEVRLGATWIDKEYIQQFMYETFNTPFYLQRSIEVNYSSFTAEWQIKGKSSVSYNDVAAYTTYGTSRANAYKILEDSLNLRDVRIYDTIEDADGKERRVLNAKETTLAAQKQQAIREAFRDWIWRDPERRQTLVSQYNEEMNSTRPREYDGSHITFGGMNPAITLREHQKSAIAHVLYGGNTLLAHEVGAGKTFEMVAASMEAKRLGLCQKSLFVVPNHLTEQWASEFLRLYPSANILVTTKKDFETHNRKKFCARIATGDYDAIIMGHSQFERIPISRERQERLLYEQIDEITEGIAEVQASGGERFTVKQLERTRKSLEARLEKLQAEGRKDDVVTFEQLGVDRLFVDEAHNYKNLFLYTKMRNVAGLSTSDAQKSSDMFAKCRYMDEITGNRGVIFATGTPVSNSMTELYTMQRYLQYERLQELNMTHFDCWASRFGETVTALELAPEGYNLVGR
nr:SNF2-related protein [Ruminococcus bromii]